MGGLRRRLPLVFWSFVLGSAALAALPFTSGFFSKDPILLSAWEFPQLGPWLWLGALLGAALTALYSFRLVFIVFFGELRTEPDRQPGWRMSIPLGILCVLSLFGGWIGLEGLLRASHHPHVGAAVEWISIGVPVLGVLLAYLLFLGRQLSVQTLLDSASGKRLAAFWHSGWRMDALYDSLWLRPFLQLTRVLRNEPADRFYDALVQLSSGGHQLLARLQNGRLRHYVAAMVIGLMVLLSLLAGIV